MWTLLLGGCNEIGDSLEAAGTALLGAPSNLSATALPGGIQVRLFWKDNSAGEAGFRIDVNDAPFGTTPTVVNVIVVPADTTSHVYETWPGRTLYFRVLAVTAELESEPSNVVSITTPNVPLAPWLNATAVSSSSIFLSWSDVEGETGYRIERSGSPGPDWLVVGTTGSGTTTYQDAGLTPDTEYQYRLFAFNAEGDSVSSNVASAVTQTVSVTIRTAASQGDLGLWPSIALFGGTVYVAHYDLTNTNCLMTSGSPSAGYSTFTLDAGPTASSDVGWGTALAADSAGYHHVLAYDRSNADLRYITNYPGPSYVAATIDSAGSVGARPKIAISPLDGTLHAVYLRGSNQIRHAMFRNGVWTFQDILPTTYFLSSFDLAMDGSGRPHISISRSADGGAYELVHAVREGDSWVFTTITGKDQPQDNSIAIGPDGRPHVAYYTRGLSFRLMHAEPVGGSWITEVIHEDVDVGRSNSIAIHPISGRIHVAYYDALNQDLRYARKDPGGSWVLRLIDSEGNVGGFTDIAVDPGGGIHIAYRDESKGDLKVASGLP